MARYAHIIIATGIVDNVSEWNGVGAYTPPEGIELRLADDNAEVGGSWDGSAFTRAPIIAPTRTEVLMNEVVQPKKFNDDGEIVDKTADEVAAEKTELLALLHAALVNSDLNQPRTQMMLRLERE